MVVVVEEEEVKSQGANCSQMGVSNLQDEAATIRVKKRKTTSQQTTKLATWRQWAMIMTIIMIIRRKMLNGP